jgi:adenylate cyclase class IV
MTIDAISERIERSLPVRLVNDSAEREVKVFDVELPLLRKRLAALPRVESFEGMVRTRELVLHEQPDAFTLKYRAMDGRPTTIILKGEKQPHPKYKVRREVTWELTEELSYEEVASRLDGVYLEEVAKHRESYEAEDEGGHFHLDIDQDPVLGLIVEIEGSTDEAIARAIELLGLQGKPLSSEGRSGLLRRKAQGLASPGRTKPSAPE